MSRRGYDVVVVGAGIAGAAVAHACAARGARVALVDRDEPGRHASGAAAGMLAPRSEAAGPGPFLSLCGEALSAWPALAERLLDESGIDCELWRCGVLRVALDEADEAEVRARIAWQRPAGAGVEWLDASAARGLEPALATVRGAAWYADEGHVHSPVAVRALVEAARRRGAELRCGAEVTASAAAGGVVLAGGERLLAGSVVVAAGAWTGAVCERLGAGALPVRPVRGQLLALRRLASAPSRVVYGGHRGYAVTKRSGLTLVGTTEEEAGYDARVTAAATERLLAIGGRLLAGFGEATVVGAWAGLRPCAPDRLPLLGRLGRAGSAELLVSSGHFRNGVLLAPATGEGLARIALEDDPPAGWESFDPRRLR